MSEPQQKPSGDDLLANPFTGQKFTGIEIDHEGRTCGLGCERCEKCEEE